MFREFIHKISLLCGVLLTLTACSPAARQIQLESHLQQGKRFFEAGFYKRAMQELLPSASDGNPEAEYAVGYMYYYGYGVAQDTDTGYFWISRSAAKGYIPAQKALVLIEKEKTILRPVKRIKTTP